MRRDLGVRSPRTIDAIEHDSDNLCALLLKIAGPSNCRISDSFEL
jgi:hypothetical protein